MRSTPSELLAHLASGWMNIAYLIKFRREDGIELFVTDHDEDIEYPIGSGDIYASHLGYEKSAIQHSDKLSVDTLGTKGFLSDLGISANDIAAGLWDFCEVWVYVVNYKDLSIGSSKQFRGYIGQISVAENELKNELRGLTQKLQSTVGITVTEICRHDLFSVGPDECNVPIIEGTNKFSATPIASVITDQRSFIFTSFSKPLDFFRNGKVVWESGLNAGLSKEIKTHLANGTIELHEAMPYSISPGDNITLYAGCTGRYSEDCVGKFNNGPRFGGFPFVPGLDRILKGPL